MPSSLVADVLDVGHGSCVVVRDGGDVVIVDAGPGAALLEYLEREGIQRISAVLISHADADHIGGLAALLAQEIQVDRIYWNGDSLKGSDLWRDLIYLIGDLNRAGRTLAESEVAQGAVIAVGAKGDHLKVLAPDLVLRRLGAGSRTKEGHRVSSNSVSAVVQLVVDGEPLLMIPGDLDQLGFEHLSNHVTDGQLRSKYLLLPHHGGLLGTVASTAGTIKALVRAVSPEGIFISNGRGKFDNPRADVIAAIREVTSAIPIRCTQLSKGCSAASLIRDDANEVYSAGWTRGASCAGSMRLSETSGIASSFQDPRHVLFLSESVPKRLCGAVVDS